MSFRITEAPDMASSTASEKRLFLRSEIAVDQHGGDAGVGGDLAHAGAVIAMGGEGAS